MSNGKYKTERGMMVARDGVEVNVRDDGSVHVKAGDQELHVDEIVALNLHDLLSTVIEYHSE